MAATRPPRCEQTHARCHADPASSTAAGYELDARPAVVGALAPYQIAIGDVSAPEGDDGPTDFDFRVTLSTPSEHTVTVRYATQQDTAAEGSDYDGTAGMLTFAPGETSKIVTVTVNGDTDAEADEAFAVVLSDAVNAILIPRFIQQRTVIDIGETGDEYLYWVRQRHSHS